MKTYDFVHLVLHAANGRIQGRTKLQKMVYFAGVLADCLEDLNYRPHFYGPYSSKVAASLDKLRSLEFIHQRVQGGGSVDPHGFEIARYDYELTEDGRIIAEEKAAEHSEEWKQIRTAIEQLEREGDLDYIKLSIAAKTYFLLKDSPGKSSEEIIESLSHNFGWKVTEDEVRDALRWLEAVGLWNCQSSK